MGASAAWAQRFASSPDWTQIQGGAAHPGFVAEGAAPPFRQAWRVDVPTGGFDDRYGLSAPVLSGSLAIAVGPTEVVGFDLTTHSTAWSVDRTYGPPAPPAVARSADRTLVLFTEGFGDSAPSSSPSPSPSSSATTDETAFPSFLAAIDQSTQEPAWDAPVQLKEVSRTGVTVDGDAAYVGDNRGNVYAVDVATGDVLWTSDVGVALASSLAVSSGTVVAAVQGDRTTAARLVALHADTGDVTWSEDVSGTAIAASTPAIDGNTIYAGFSDQTIRAFALDSGSELWSARINAFGIVGPPAVAPDALVVEDSAGQLYRFDPSTGQRIWDFALNEAVARSSPVVIGDVVVAATNVGRLAAFDLASGRLVWESGTTSSPLRNPTPSGEELLLVAGGMHPGLVAYETDPNGALVSVVSPTELDAGRLVLNWVVAALPIVVALVLGGRWLLGLLGPAFLPADEEAIGSEPADGKGGG